MRKNEILNYPLITQQELEIALNNGIRQTNFALSRLENRFKHIFSTNQFYSEAPNNQWTNGFWTGELWLAYEYTKDYRYCKVAMAHVASFLYRIENQIHTDTHDLGFLYTPSCVAAYKLTGDKSAKETALKAADLLLERFRENGQFIQAWGKIDDEKNYRLIIDCLLNLPLLYWAGEVTGDSIYTEKANIHAQTALKILIRSDYSTFHTYYFDFKTGKPSYGATHQGYSAESAWSRGQAWGIYGIALSYHYSKNPEYLILFEQVTEYFINHLPKNLIPYWDLVFTDGSQEPRDSSAAAIAACGMLEMARCLQGEKSAYYMEMGSRLVKALYDTCAVKTPKESDGQLLHGVYGKKTQYNDCIDHGIDECNLWGDYFYMESLVRLHMDWVPYW